MKKKVLSVLLATACVVSMAACGGSSSDDSSKETTGKEETTEETAAIESRDDLEGKKIGVQQGTTGDLAVTDEFGDESVERYNKGFEAVQALTQGKIDAVVIDDLPAQEFVKQSEGLKILDGAYSEEEYALCFEKENQELCDQFNDVIQELKDDGTFEQIANSYIGDSAGENYYESPEDVDRSNGTLVMATNAEFPPYEYYEGEDIVGLDADFAQAIADKLGMDLKIEDMAFDSIIPAVTSGKADFGASGMTVTFLAVLIGILLGLFVAIVRSTYDKTHKLKILNFICNIYITVIRGTPVVVQLLIIYFVVFASMDVSKVFVAVMAFGMNSGAYVAEIFRSGIMSIDQGQFEAGRSLGFNYAQTMVHIIMPQAFKNVLPALGNEFIVLLKETSVAGYIALQDLTKGGDIIRSRTYDAFMPLIAVALIYLVMVMIFTKLVALLERRLRNSDH